MTALTSCALLESRSVRAEQRELAPSEARSWRDSVQQAVAAGSYLPLSLTPEVGASAAQGSAQTGYDGARKHATLRSFAQATVYGPLALRLGVASSNAGRLAPSAGARVQLLNQRDYGVSLAASVFYKAEGFTELEGEIESVLSLARRFDDWLLVSSIAYGQDPEGHERDAELTFACMLQLSRLAHLGLDARGRLDLGSQRQPPRAAAEPVSDFQAGPLLSLALGPLAVTAQAGVSGLRSVDQTNHVGFVGVAGLGSAF
ncbi:MAG TPA: hypothetical protein VHB79_03890 [Polyangiaceae bacterium]|nr:hypothetical protein [Polyangiaceae bacterium]